ncbi:MAG: DEAD/DEAH box helicase [Candidatus Micrarchaeota archaeon]|nr:DEAD/DEAH box helicase [Candidatus Micrarchaeota archaeon]
MLPEKLQSLFRARFGSHTPIQEKAIPIISAGGDALVIAPTGSGKTEAVLLPMLAKIHSSGAEPVALLYITPLRALNRDLVERVRSWAKELGLRVSVRHGDTTPPERSFQSRHPAHIFITTPETLQIMLCTRSFRSHFRNLRHVVIDELHELVASKRGAQLSLGITRLRSLAGFQTVAVSATLQSPERAGALFLREGFSVVRDTSARRPHITVEIAKGATEGERLDFICSEIRKSTSEAKTLVFTNTRYMAELVSSRLIAGNADVGVHHGSLSKEERENVEERFKSGAIKCLVCTSSLELGIDIGDVERVVHIGSPKQVRKALQRIGRSGHSHGRQAKGLIIAHNLFDLCEAEVIAEMARAGELEPDDIIYPCTDVLLHAIAGELVARGKIGVGDIRQLCSENPLYSQLGWDAIVAAISEGHRNGVLFFDGESVRPTGKTHNYYFLRVSTIPSSAKYMMESHGRAIGYLDERFVASLSEGDVFITRGTPWSVLSIEDGRVTVEQSPGYTLAIPEWEGEQIPVRREVAERVRARMGFGRKLLVHKFADMLIIYSFLGSAANNALALALASRISSYFSAEVGVKSSPYAVFVKSPYPISKDLLARIVSGMSIVNEIRSSLAKNSTFSLTFSQEAFYFGMADEHKRYPPFFVSRLSASEAYSESLRHFMYRYCDPAPAQALVDSAFVAGGVEFQELSALPPIALDALDHMSGSQVLFPDIPESAALSLLGRAPSTFGLICANCGHKFYGQSESPPSKCPKCTSVLVAPVMQNERKALGRDELMRRASLYRSYGKRAIIALSTYGVGTDTASRILARMHKDEKALAIDLLKARENFIRTKKYWSPAK